MHFASLLWFRAQSRPSNQIGEMHLPCEACCDVFFALLNRRFDVFGRCVELQRGVVTLTVISTIGTFSLTTHACLHQFDLIIVKQLTMVFLFLIEDSVCNAVLAPFVQQNDNTLILCMLIYFGFTICWLSSIFLRRMRTASQSARYGTTSICSTFELPAASSFATCFSASMLVLV